MHKYIVSFIGLMALLAFSSANAQHILVFTDSQHPVYSLPQQTRVFELDQAQQIEEQLSDELTTDQHQSAALARSRLNSYIHQKLAQAYEGVVNGWSLGVHKIPAVVVDRRYVIYGEPDVSRALSRIQTYREANP